MKRSTTDWAVLALLLGGEAHGFRLAAVFARNGELGEIWTIQRPQVYRALEHLVDSGLAKPLRVEAGDAGGNRTLYALTKTGQKEAEAWLQEPITQLRHGRSELRLKLAFLLRQGRSLEPLLGAQAQVYQEILAALEPKLVDSTPLERISLLWRIEMAQAGLRFVQHLQTQELV